jgi:hypothetical protein
MMKKHLFFNWLATAILLAGCVPASWLPVATPIPTEAISTVVVCPTAEPCPERACAPCPPTPTEAPATNTYDAPYLEPDRVAAARQAIAAIQALRNKDFDALALLSTSYLTLSPSVEGLLQAYSPYQDELRGFATDTSPRQWGTDAAGNMVESSFDDFYDRFLYNLDYASAPVISINYSAATGVYEIPWEIASEPLPYANTSVVEFYMPTAGGQANEWQALRLYLTPRPGGEWVLRAIAHAGMTPPVDSIGSTTSPNDVEIPPKAQVFLMAMDAIQAFRLGDMAQVAEMVHPDRGLRFSPYSNVREGDQVLSAVELAAVFADPITRLWGAFDGSGKPINLAFNEYFHIFVYDSDFARHGIVSLDLPISGGNIIDNSREFYPAAVIVEFYQPGTELYTGMDWSALKMVFQQVDGTWYLVGLIHSNWTI